MLIEDIVQILMVRDHLSPQDARECVEKCQEELDMIVSAGGSIEDAEDCIAYWLSLEPDYLSVLLDV